MLCFDVEGPYQEHALVQTVRAGLRDQLIGTLLVSLCPLVLDLQLPQLLCSCKGSLETVGSAGKVVLALVKHLLALQDIEDPPLLLETLFGV